MSTEVKAAVQGPAALESPTEPVPASSASKGREQSAALARQLQDYFTAESELRREGYSW